ncbi:MAG: hypothetical protein WCD37_08270 [Chloroflexia bacterium]
MSSYRLAWRVVMLFLLAALLLYAAYFAYHAYRLARARGEVNYAESTWLFASLRVRHGLTPYFDYTQAPYVPMAYPPLLPELAGGTGALLGAGDGQVITLTRLFSLGSALSISLAIALACRAFGVKAIPSAIAGLLFLTPEPTFTLWSAAARSDMLAVALGLLAVALLLTASKRSPAPTWSLALGGVLGGLAIMAKQTAIAPLLAIVLWLALTGGGRASRVARMRAILIVVTGALVSMLVALAPFGLEGAQQLWRSTLDLASHPQSPAALYTRLDNLVTMFGLCFPLSALGIWVLTLPKEDNKAPANAGAARSLFLIYAGVAALVLVLTSAKLGSASSYCLETIAVLCVAAGVGLGALGRLVERAERLVGVALLVLAIAPLATQAWYASKTAQSSWVPGPDDGPLAALAQPNRGPVLSENGYILLNGAEPPLLLDPLFFSVQERAGRWDSEPLTKMAQGREFVSVVLFHPIETTPSVDGVSWIPAETYAAIKSNYTLLGTHGRYYVYVPKSP